MRDANDIGVLWHDDEHLALHVQSGMPRDDGQDRYSGVMIQNDESDGLWVMNDGPPTEKSSFQPPEQFRSDRT